METWVDRWQTQEMVAIVGGVGSGPLALNLSFVGGRASKRSRSTARISIEILATGTRRRRRSWN